MAKFNSLPEAPNTALDEDRKSGQGKPQLAGRTPHSDDAANQPGALDGFSARDAGKPPGPASENIEQRVNIG